jgi:hypothetical protein
MFKLINEEVECLGKHGYFTTRRVSFGNSPKECYSKMRRYNGEHTVSGGHPEGWGGTPVLLMTRLEKNGKMLSEVWG